MKHQKKFNFGITLAIIVIIVLITGLSITAYQHTKFRRDLLIGNATPEEYFTFFVPDTERVSAAVFNCQGGNFYFSLTREQITQLQNTFDNQSELAIQTVGILEIPAEHQNLIFEIDRQHLREIVQEIENNPEVNSVILIKQISPESITGSWDIPKDQYAVKAFFNSSMTAKIYNSFQMNPGTCCIINQAVDIDCTIKGKYSIPYDAVLMMYGLFQNNPDAKCVSYDAELYLSPATATPTTAL